MLQNYIRFRYYCSRVYVAIYSRVYVTMTTLNLSTYDDDSCQQMSNQSSFLQASNVLSQHQCLILSNATLLCNATSVWILLALRNKIRFLKLLSCPRRAMAEDDWRRQSSVPKDGWGRQGALQRTVGGFQTVQGPWPKRKIIPRMKISPPSISWGRVVTTLSSNTR